MVGFIYPLLAIRSKTLIAFLAAILLARKHNLMLFKAVFAALERGGHITKQRA